jgi:hypothetical protein
MAVSLPVLVLVYELLFRGRRATLTPSLIAAGITALFIAAKTLGPAALTNIDAYRPSYTWARFGDSNARFLNEILYTDVFTPGRVLVLWAALLYLSLRNWSQRKFDPRWFFLLIWVLITPLPIAFLPNRSGATLYIVSAGWAMLAALALRAILHRFARQPLAGLRRSAIMNIGLAACIAGYWHETRRADQIAVPRYLKNGEDTQQAIAQIQGLHVLPEPNSIVAFRNDPFPEGYDTLFIAALTWRDPTIDIWLQNHRHLPEKDLAGAKYIFDYVDGRFVAASLPAEH